MEKAELVLAVTSSWVHLYVDHKQGPQFTPRGKHHTTLAVSAISLQKPSKVHPHNVPKSQ